MHFVWSGKYFIVLFLSSCILYECMCCHTCHTHSTPQMQTRPPHKWLLWTSFLGYLQSTKRWKGGNSQWDITNWKLTKRSGKKPAKCITLDSRLFSFVPARGRPNLSLLGTAGLWHVLWYFNTYVVSFPHSPEALKCKIVIMVSSTKLTTEILLFYTLTDTLSISSSHGIKEGWKQGTNRGQNAAEPQNLVICVNVELLNILSSFLLFLYFRCFITLCNSTNLKWL